jgi:hypothetical protein
LVRLCRHDASCDGKCDKIDGNGLMGTTGAGRKRTMESKMETVVRWKRRRQMGGGTKERMMVTVDKAAES